MIYKPKYFDIHEYVYPKLYKEYLAKGEVYKLYGCIDERVFITNDRIRDFINKNNTNYSVTVNNWYWGGAFSESGLRDPNTKTGAGVSQHKYGRASDSKFDTPEWNPEKLREYMKSIGCFEPGFKMRKDKEAYPFLLINRIEWSTNEIMSWFHFDMSPLAPEDGSIGIVRVNI
jgi:hypothetical protein